MAIWFIHVIRAIVISHQVPSAIAHCNVCDLDMCFSLMRTESKRMQGTEFKLEKAIPVDMFPQTSHCELVMLFTRE